MLDQGLIIGSKTIVNERLCLLKSVVAQALRFDRDLAHLTSTMGQLMQPATIYPSAIVSLRIKLFKCDSTHLAYTTGQLCNMQQFPPEQLPH